MGWDESQPKLKVKPEGVAVSRCRRTPLVFRDASPQPTALCQHWVGVGLSLQGASLL